MIHRQTGTDKEKQRHCQTKREKIGERKRPTFHSPRSETICDQLDKHCHCFEGILGDTAERRGGARMGLSKRC